MDDLSKLANQKVHLTPEDFIAEIDEFADGSEPRARLKYYVEPYGPHGTNEVCEANYFVGNKVPYHEHGEGTETFLVDGGSFEIYSRGRKAIAAKGDLIHIPPFTPHQLITLEDDSKWRAIHQSIDMTPGMIDERRLRDRYPDLFNDEGFKKRFILSNHKTLWYDYEPDAIAELVPTKEFREIRAYDYGLAEFSYKGIGFRLKVGRWETLDIKEVWQLLFPDGKGMSWQGGNPYDILLAIFAGSVTVELDGEEPFTANARDILHIPKFWAGSVKADGDAVVFDFGCKGHLLRFLDELNAITKTNGSVPDDEKIAAIMDKNDWFVNFG